MLSRSSILLALVASTSALNLWPRQTGSCPAVWTDVAKELSSTFSTCGRAAHGAIRAPFHDCINNGCDGSLILTDECSRSENGGLSFICGVLLDLTNKYKVSAADMIQFAAAYAISACPLGPKVRALVGRTDSSVAAPLNSMPSSRDSVDSILVTFKARGFSSDDVVALLGTHSVAIQVVTDPNKAGKPLDSTPAVYDTKFYTETQAGTAPSSLDSDLRMSNDTQVCSIRSSLNFAVANVCRLLKLGRTLATAKIFGLPNSLMHGIAFLSSEMMSTASRIARVLSQLTLQRSGGQ